MTEPSGQPAAVVPSQDERTWAMLAHLSALAGYLIPFANIFGPLIVWSMKKEGSPFVDDQGKESLNFQISLTIYILAAVVLIIVLIGIPLLIGLAVAGVILIIIGAVKANEGIAYRYPLTIRFIK